MKNPYISAFEALTDEDAKLYYQKRAQEDIDTMIDVGHAIYQVCAYIYALGAQAGKAHYDAVSTHTKAAEPVQPCLPEPKAIAALPPAKPLALPAAQVVGILCEAVDRTENYLRLTKRQLIAKCSDLGLTPKKSMSKRQLVDMLSTALA